MRSTAPVTMQRMNGEPGGTVVEPPDDPARVGVVANLGSYTEGEVVTMTLRRLGGRGDTAVSVGYAFSSAAGAADFETPPTGTVTLGQNKNEVIMSVDTVERANAQGDRTITCTLTGISNGVIDAAYMTATTTLKDKITTPPGDKWWLQDDWRSGRKWRGGGGYFNTIANYNKYEQQVAYLDCLGGPNTGDQDQAVQSRDQAFGGPAGNPNTIMNGSQLDWTQSYEFSTIFKDAANKVNDKRIIFWVCDWMAVADRTDLSGSHNTFWTAVNNGNFDNYIKAMGKRVVLNCQRIGLDPKWLHARPFHEMQQSNYYRIWQDSKVNFKNAMERMIDLYKEGAQTDLRVAFSPAKDKKWKDNSESVYQDFGTFESWAPTNCDYVSMSFHPAGPHDDRAEILKFLNGNDAIYGVNDQVAEWCAKYGKPIGPLEWSPRYQSNHIADEVYNIYYREHLWPRANDIGVVCDAVFDQRTLDKNAADNQAGQTPLGRENWADGVDVYKHFWKGKGPNWTNFSPPLTNLPAVWYP